VSHPFLYPADVGLGDHPCAEGVAEVMEAQRPQARGRERRLVAAPQR
jgi:hypothetical protein